MTANQIVVTYITANGATAKIEMSDDGRIKVGDKADLPTAIIVIAATGDESEATVAAIDQA